MMEKHTYFMKEALKEAQKAYNKNEVPVGAVVVFEGKIIARAHNLRELNQDFLAHAEILAMKKAAKKLKSWRLEGCTLYVTLEPCTMCTGAMIQARIQALYFGAKDPKTGAIESVLNLLDTPFNHQIKYMGGILEDASSKLLKSFFKKLR